MKLSAGRLDRTIVLQRRTVTDDVEPTETWGPLPQTAPQPTEVRAQVVQQSGRELFAADQLQAERKVLFRIRWRSDVTEKDRVLYDGRIHDIHEVRELGRRDGLELFTTTRGETE